MKTIYPNDLSHRDRHQLLLGGVSPRPIAFVTTINPNGVTNLAPFSFFGAYSSKPPTVAIGPAIGAKTGVSKDSWTNIVASGECTISTVSYDMVHKTNLTSAPYPTDISEYTKGGFTEAQSVIVKPPFVAESPYSMECKLVESIEIRRDIGGNGNLLLLEVVAFHVAERVFDADGNIAPLAMDLVGRMGLSWYTKTRDVFWAVQPAHLPIGMDRLPEAIKQSTILTGNDLAKLAYVPSIPERDGAFLSSVSDAVVSNKEDVSIANSPGQELLALVQEGRVMDNNSLHRIAQVFIAEGNVDAAWQTLLLQATE